MRRSIVVFQLPLPISGVGCCSNLSENRELRFAVPDDRSQNTYRSSSKRNSVHRIGKTLPLVRLGLDESELLNCLLAYATPGIGILLLMLAPGHTEGTHRPHVAGLCATVFYHCILVLALVRDSVIRTITIEKR